MSPTYEPPGFSRYTPSDAAGAVPAGQREWALPQPGQVVGGKYRVEATIGQGGLAVVLRAFHLQLEEPVALKILSPAWATSAEIMQRFVDEGRSATKIRSEHVVRIYDVGVLDEGAPYIVMECLEGSDLDALVRDHGPLPVDAAMSYVLQAGEAIAEAHANGIVHRDLKPANLFLTHRADGSHCIKVLDFGISKRTDPNRTSSSRRMTAPNAVMGSPHYMSPEQVLTPHEVDLRCDVWALGAILYELIAGKPPFDCATLPELYHAIVETTAPPLGTLRDDVSPVLETIVARCMKKNPDERFQSVAELAVALAALDPAAFGASAERIVRVLGGGQPLGAAASAPRLAPGVPAFLGSRPQKRKRGALAAVATLAVIGAAAFGAHKYAETRGGWQALASEPGDRAEPSVVEPVPAAPAATSTVSERKLALVPAPPPVAAASDVPPPTVASAPPPTVASASPPPEEPSRAPVAEAPPPPAPRAAPPQPRVAPPPSRGVARSAPRRAPRPVPAAVSEPSSPPRFAEPSLPSPPPASVTDSRGSSPDPDGLFEERK